MPAAGNSALQDCSAEHVLNRIIQLPQTFNRFKNLKIVSIGLELVLYCPCHTTIPEIGGSATIFINFAPCESKQ